MHPPTYQVSLRTEPYGSPGPRWVVTQAEAELVHRYGGLDDGELGLSAAMFDPPLGCFLVAQIDGASHPVGGRGSAPLATRSARSGDSGSTQRGEVGASAGSS